MNIPQEHVHWQGIIEAIPEQSVPFAVHVFIFETREQLRELTGSPSASAWSSTFETPDENNIGALMFFNLEDIELSLAAHEATHVALCHAANKHDGETDTRRWLTDHPEWVAEMIGNLTILIWSALYAARPER